MSSKSHAATDDLTPLSPAVFHILLSLGGGERHGYALKREISLRTGGKLKLGPGVLYGSFSSGNKGDLLASAAEKETIGCIWTWRVRRD